MHIIIVLSMLQVWSFYKLHKVSFWTTKKLSPSEHVLFSMILAFFASADSIVNKNILQNFFSKVQLLEAYYFYTFQAMMENIHSKHLVAFMAVEGIFFSSSFAMIYWIKCCSVMPGLCFSNELICRDKSLHTDFVCLLYSRLKSKLLINDVTCILIEAYIIPSDLLGMKETLIHQYIEFVTDQLIVTLRGSKLYCVGNPFPFMDIILKKIRDQCTAATTGMNQYEFI
ncbi:ribonucleoside-diphosphate reductase [Armillaria nabsnona]|nr:ribonucleoside-diphosphate reductase [Armillaria nabsnona]